MQRVPPASRSGLSATTVAMVDLGQAILYRPCLSSMGSLRLERAARLRNHWQHLPVQSRPMMSASGRGAAAMVHLIDENRSGSAEEMERRFARALVEWLRSHGGKSPEARTVVFAPPHFLGRLREVHADGFELVHGDLTKLTASQLARHPAVIEALFGSIRA